MSFHRLDNPIRTYEWGSTTAFSELLGIPNPTGEPRAELWMGAHPDAPSRIDGVPLGERVELPYLFKVLAAAKPLSIQAHPSRKQAILGFTREDAAGIPRDAPHRNYRDPNRKPEIICALTPFEALCGFRSPEAIVATFRELAIPELEAALDRFSIPSFLEAVLRHSGDLCVHMLNRIQLAPGEAIFLPSRTLHAYLHGTGIELMANSNNVLRGGLTHKHIDIPELLRILQFRPSCPAIIHGETNGPVTHYPCPAEEFVLSRIDLTNASHTTTATGPEILLCTSGDLGLISRGESVFVEAGTAYTLRGSGRAFRASAGG